jgi:hypothetical protein
MHAETRLTERDLFWYSNDPYSSDYQKGIECQACGAAVINTERHVEWHNQQQA